MSTPRSRRIIGPLAEFLQTEAAGGAVLLAAALLGVIWANSPWSDAYASFWSSEVGLGSGDLALRLDLRHWVNEGLMALFFFVVGLEIKRELVVGELRRPRTALLPGMAAVGGMVLPAAIYALVNVGGPGGRGWGIPMATDIAFAVGVLALLGSRVPRGLRLFLLTLAIVDDVGAIVVIALFYSGGVAWVWLGVAAGVVGAVVALRALQVSRPFAYVIPGVVLWLALHEAGLHATLAGVALGLLTPARPFRGRRVLERLEHVLHPWSSFLVVPLFGLPNAGVSVGAAAIAAAATSPVTLGVVLGLVVGKAAGIAAATAIAVRSGLGTLPAGVRRRHVLGAAALGGIGFTVSLFVADLALTGAALDAGKIGILAGSAVSGLLGVAVIATAPRRAGGTAGSGRRGGGRARFRGGCRSGSNPRR